MRVQLTRDIRASIQKELNAERDTLQRQRDELERKAADLEASQKSVDEQVKAKLADARRQLMEKDAALSERLNQIDEEVAKKVSADRQKLAEEQKQLLVKQEHLEDEISKRLESERHAITEKLRGEAEQQYHVELKARDAQIASLSERVKDATDKELTLLKQKQELEQRQESLELEIARTLDEERALIRKEAMEQATEQHDLKVKERDQVISRLHEQINDMKCKLEQGSQQLQGEVMEIELEALLAELFPNDTIEPVGKGIRGADVLHTVNDSAGRACGRILWESKRTKAWQATWLPKLRQDQRNAKADCCAIVSAVLPEGIQSLGEVDGVWIANWRCIAGLAAALRAGIITTASARLALEGQQGKMEQVYNYLSGSSSGSVCRASSRHSSECRRT